MLFIILAIVLCLVSALDLLITGRDVRAKYYLGLVVLFVVIGVPLSDKEIKHKYKNGPILEASIPNTNCEEYSYYSKVIYKCDGRVVNISE